MCIRDRTYTSVAVVTGGLKATSPGSPTSPLNAYESEYCLMDWAREGWSVIRGQATMGLSLIHISGSWAATP